MAKEIEKSETVPIWNGDVAAIDSYVMRVKLYACGAQMDEKGLCGPRLMAKLQGRTCQGARKYDMPDPLVDDVEEDLTMKPTRQRRQHRQRTYAAEGNDDSESEDEDLDDGGLNELFPDTASAPAAADDDEIGDQLQEICDQAGDGEELRQELLEGAVFAAAQTGAREASARARALARPPGSTTANFSDAIPIYCDQDANYSDATSIYCDPGTKYSDTNAIHCDQDTTYCDANAIYCVQDTIYSDTNAIYCDQGPNYGDLSAIYCDPTEIFPEHLANIEMKTRLRSPKEFITRNVHDVYYLEAGACAGNLDSGWAMQGAEPQRQKELQAINKLLRVAPSSFAKSDVLTMSLWTNAEVPVGIENYLAAALLRAASTTVTEWRRAHSELCDTAYDQLPITTVLQGVWCNDCWEIKTAIVQRFEGVINSTFFVDCKGSRLKRLTRTAGPRPRAGAAMIASHKRAAKAGMEAELVDWYSNANDHLYHPEHGLEANYFLGDYIEEGLQWAKDKLRSDVSYMTCDSSTGLDDFTRRPSEFSERWPPEKSLRTILSNGSHLSMSESHLPGPWSPSDARSSAQKALVSVLRWGRVVSHESVMARAAEQTEEQVRRRASREAQRTVREGSRLLLASTALYGAPLGEARALASLAAEACTVLAGCLLAAKGLRRPSLRAYHGVLLALGLYVVAFPLLPTEPSCDDQWLFLQCARGNRWWRADMQGCGPQGLSSSVMGITVICMSPHIVPELKAMLLFVALFVAGYLTASAIYLYATELGYYSWVDILVAIILLGAATVIAAYRKYKMEVQRQYMDLLYHRKAHTTKKLLDLLQDFLPDHIIVRMLKEPSATTAEQIPKASVLFLLISGFEGHMNQRTPDQLLDFLNIIFGKIDRICFDCQVTKIETVGEEYVAAVGVKPQDRSKEGDMHEDALNRLIVAAQAIFMSQEGDMGEPLTSVQFRMGMHTGPVVAGVVGQKLPRFRLFGDTMNTAARMMQKGVDGELQFGEETRACMPSWARYRSRGKVDMKGKGQVETYLLDRLSEGSAGDVWENIRSYKLRKARRGSLDSIISLSSHGSDSEDERSAEQEDPVTGRISACTWIWGARLKRLERLLVKAVRGDPRGGDASDIEWLQEFYYFRIASHLGRRSDRLAIVFTVLTAAEALAAELLQPRMGVVFGVRRIWMFLAMRAVLLALIFRWRAVAQNKDWILASPNTAALWRLAHACALLTLQFAAYALLVVPLVDELSLDLSASHARDKLRREPLRIPLWQLMFLLWYGTSVMDLQLRQGPTVCFVAFSLGVPLVLAAAFPAARNLASAVQLVSMLISVKVAQQRMDSILSQLMPPLVAIDLSRRPSSTSANILHQRVGCSHYYRQATIACSDLVGFTALASARSATEVVELISDLFGRFDRLSDIYRICKIETVGDAYIAGQAAQPLTLVYRPISVVIFAVEIVEAVRSWSSERDIPLDCRVGVHTGECVGGVVGVEMKRYHLFGHLLSTLELLESTAPTGQVHLSSTCQRALEEQASVEGLCDEVVACSSRMEPVLRTSKGEEVPYKDVGGAPTFVVQRCSPELYDPQAGAAADASASTGTAFSLHSPGARTPLGASRGLRSVPGGLPMAI
ncbi:unnamed protein product [Prorocentrum cordatum]|uniref:Guanylate cyclase domain-containing protein n=1 Tax=Prorocentrum cordatum TaxID=2364126 RepID=A0ABN9U319_9DINO|nr:unnamed protein product [Polarella glacialis]